jgi:transcriptional regulator with XRE-family HTH domain
METIDDNNKPIDLTKNLDKLTIPDEVPDFGDLLRQIRRWHGMTIAQLSKRISLDSQKISKIELSDSDLPPENILSQWLGILGLSRQDAEKVILISRTFRVKHWVTLNRKETANTDIIRLLDTYRLGALTDYDRTLLRLLCRR